MGRKEQILAGLSNKNGLIAFIVSAGTYFGVYFYQITTTAGSFTSFVTAFAPWYVYSSLPMAVAIALLIGINISLMMQTFRAQGGIKKVATSSGLGVFLGVLASGCPGCVVGLFPAFMALFGISATLAILPGAGLELQALSVVLLVIATYVITNPQRCKLV